MSFVDQINHMYVCPYPVFLNVADMWYADREVGTQYVITGHTSGAPQSSPPSESPLNRVVCARPRAHHLHFNIATPHTNPAYPDYPAYKYRFHTMILQGASNAQMQCTLPAVHSTQLWMQQSGDAMPLPLHIPVIPTNNAMSSAYNGHSIQPLR